MHYFSGALITLRFIVLKCISMHFLNILSLVLQFSKKIEKLGLELNGNKQRLEQAQQDVTGAREECLKLTELLSKSEHQLHLTRYPLSYYML